MILNNNILSLYQTLRQNPMQVLTQKFNIPQGLNINDPNAIIQHLLNSGQISQQQVNNVMNLRNDPMIQQLMQRR